MSELELIIDLHKGTPRQGPGSEKDSLKALSFMDLPKDKTLKIADLGCGSGGQTLTLAQHTHSEILAIDLFQEFLDELEKRSKDLGFEKQIKTKAESIVDLKIEKESLDVIWSEGAIYNMGFEKGIQYWHQFLKPKGYLAISEITWITQERPKEIEEFWMKEYPEVDTASNKIQQLESNGYTLCGYFYLSEKSWVDEYYRPLQSGFESFLDRHNHSAQAKEVIEMNQAEIELYNKFKAYYSYGFYIARKD
mgnify:CR=1 FL=1